MKIGASAMPGPKSPVLQTSGHLGNSGLAWLWFVLYRVATWMNRELVSCRIMAHAGPREVIIS